MKISFTGHRNKLASRKWLARLAQRHPGAVWVHGGASGFDSLVESVAKELGIKTEIHRPDYAAHGRGAPFVRNRAIVDAGSLLVTNYDGRKSGGTAYTVGYARKQGREVLVCD